MKPVQRCRARVPHGGRTARWRSRPAAPLWASHSLKSWAPSSATDISIGSRRPNEMLRSVYGGLRSGVTSGAMSGARGLHRLEVCELVPPLRFLVHLIRVEAGGARLTVFCFLCPASAVWRRVGSAGLAAHGSLVLHLLPWRAILRALCNAVGIQSPAFAQGGSAPEGGRAWPAILPCPTHGVAKRRT